MFKKVNMDFKKKISIQTFAQEWIESPSRKVLRIPLEREQEESGHVTSIVKYLPGSKFSSHGHPKGEEIFVLEGTFSDEFGDYPEGSYLRNPPGSSHSPFSKGGCTLFVKLDQFKKGDLKQLVINTSRASWSPGHGGLEVMPLHSYETCGTALVKWPKGEKFIPHSHFGGEEIYVLKGTFKDEFGEYSKGTWLRSPHLSQHHPWADEETIILVKTGHLEI